MCTCLFWSSCQSCFTVCSCKVPDSQCFYLLLTLVLWLPIYPIALPESCKSSWPCISVEHNSRSPLYTHLPTKTLVHTLSLPCESLMLVFAILQQGWYITSDYFSMLLSRICSKVLKYWQTLKRAPCFSFSTLYSESSTQIRGGGGGLFNMRWYSTVMKFFHSIPSLSEKNPSAHLSCKYSKIKMPQKR